MKTGSASSTVPHIPDDDEAAWSRRCAGIISQDLRAVITYHPPASLATPIYPQRNSRRSSSGYDREERASKADHVAELATPYTKTEDCVRQSSSSSSSRPDQRRAVAARGWRQGCESAGLPGQVPLWPCYAGPPRSISLGGLARDIGQTLFHGRLTVSALLVDKPPGPPTRLTGKDDRDGTSGGGAPPASHGSISTLQFLVVLLVLTVDRTCRAQMITCAGARMDAGDIVLCRSK